jgi:alkanesulfonate monooxygenase SsuD/methylene tetrahydromethanopterin reductase-like flavin-dependent oxidoreductase (luciferase family)
VKHGIFLPPFGPFGDPAALIDLAVAAEGSGWDGFFLWDHLMHRVDGPYIDAWIALSAVATRTDRLRIGPLVTPLPRRRPWKLAREAVSLDRLSGGRLVLGVGIGTDYSRELSAFGEPSNDRTRAELLDEGLEVITQLWTGESVHHSGRHFHVDGVRFLPRALQQPRIPIWCGAHWPHRRPLRRAAQYDGVVPIGDLPPAAVTDLLTEIARHRTSPDPRRSDSFLDRHDRTARIRSRRRNMVAGGIPARHAPRGSPEGHRTRPYTGVEQARAGWSQRIMGEAPKAAAGGFSRAAHNPGYVN